MNGEGIPETRKTTNIDQRKQDRRALQEDPAGELDLRCGEECFRIQAINDVSNSGISIFADQAVSAPGKVSIEYAEAGASFEVYGTVVWCTRADTMPSLRDRTIRGRYLMGIELLSPLLLINMLQKD
ncbi:MAG: PilZ domain-containing protein [Azonexus sp.]